MNLPTLISGMDEVIEQSTGIPTKEFDTLSTDEVSRRIEEELGRPFSVGKVGKYPAETKVPSHWQRIVSLFTKALAKRIFTRRIKSWKKRVANSVEEDEKRMEHLAVPWIIT